MTRIYRYILASDTGMAPCPQDAMISRGLCKPQIRNGAKQGDWVAGFMPGSDHRGELVWAGRITVKLGHDQYRKLFPNRRDAIYSRAESGEYRKHLLGYHCDEEQQNRDSNNPVLLFDPASARYFGREPEALPEHLMHLAAEGRPARVNFRQDGDLAHWEDWLSELSNSLAEPRDPLILCSGCAHCSHDTDVRPTRDCSPRKARPHEKMRRC